MEQDNTFLRADDIYEEVEGEAGKKLNLLEDQQQNLIGIIKGRYTQAEEARDSDERRWLQAYENYRGLYSKSIKLLINISSKTIFRASLSVHL